MTRGCVGLGSCSAIPDSGVRCGRSRVTSPWYSPDVSARLRVLVFFSGLISCAGARTHVAAEAPQAESCALIETDDDITSGSATAGALFVGEDELGRRLLTSDVLAVAEGFREAGFSCVVVADSHANSREHAIDGER